MESLGNLMMRLNDWSDALDHQIEGDRAELLADAADAIAALKAQRDEAGQLAAGLLEALRIALTALENADQTTEARGAQIIAREAIAKAGADRDV